jgi:diguanylate cyclase (GGDEF)-like protein
MIGAFALDLRTLFIITVLINTIIAFVMAIYWRTQTTYAGFGYWTLANVAMTVTFSLFALKGILPEFLTVVVANTVAAAGAVCRYAGVRFFWGADHLRHPRFHQFMVLGIAILFSYFTFIDENIILRMFAISLVISGYFLATARSMLSGVRKGYPYEAWTLALLNISYAVILMGRAAEWYFHPEARYILYASTMSTLYFTAILLLEVATALVFLMMNSQRLAKSLLIVQQELEKLAACDTLTGLFNRRKLAELCGQEIADARAKNQPTAMLLIDLDHLKQMNDTFGHSAGDALINTVVKIIRDQLRPTDIPGRLGGDEFLLIMPNTTQETARMIAEQIRLNVQNQVFYWEDKVLSMSLSIGIAALCAADTNWNDWLQRADCNLYQAKNSGRNQIV